jgi:hypothetical protein
MTKNDDLPLEESNPSSPDDADSTVDWLVLWTIRGSVYLFAIALVALFGALTLGLFEHSVRQWGWVAGALLAAVGYPLGWVTLSAFKLRKMSRAEQKADARQPRQTMGPVGGCFAGILMGVILGTLAWFVIVIFWVSLALSPLTPDPWREGFQTSFLFVSMPPRPTLAILGWTTGVFAVLGIVLGLCGKMYRFGPTEPKTTEP